MNQETWTIDDHLEGKPDTSVALYHEFVRLVEACGPFTYAVSKSMITVKGTRRGFAGAKPDARGLRGYFDIQRTISDDARITSVSPYTKRLYVHAFRISDLAGLDEEFAGWLREAYEVGQGGHLGTS
ncbi:hypothetical protein GBF35_03715 [Nonomuraea phyllanthi]|uniref:DUF5655 domain-containing protein n=1 Tax=Nonomuraea phyllanthi TaxID=2219224 RepID=UPI0012938ABC|nr:DUF5655 domain-containing protein [Nonomuraea phyllanthi]QFY05896.1 hypothetical protein GBF35_03715 [Nonomuraea phyllanthi]